MARLGVTRVLSYQVAAAIRTGALAVALSDFELAPWPVRLVYAAHRLLPSKLRACLDFAVPRLREKLTEAVEREPANVMTLKDRQP